MEEVKYFNIDEELTRFSALEKGNKWYFKDAERNNRHVHLKNEIAKGNAGKLVLLVEQKISLLTRKESIIKGMADLKEKSI